MQMMFLQQQVGQEGKRIYLSKYIVMLIAFTNMHTVFCVSINVDKIVARVVL